MRENLPINISVLKWARESLGLSVLEVAQKFKKKEEEILAWESGEKSPTYIQLEKLAYEIYKRPVAIFFFPEIPEEENPRTDFRTLPDVEINKLSPQLIKLYRKAKSFQYNLEELFDNEKPVPNSILDKIHLKEDADYLINAKKIRNLFAISEDEQFLWKSPEQAFKVWRKALEDNGIFIFKDAFKDNNFSGFCLYDKNYPIIYINNTMSHTRQIFTLFHELAHLLYNAGGVDFEDKNRTSNFSRKFSKIEKMCNVLASEILVPQNLISITRENFNEENININAQKFSVSREVILRKYLNARIINFQDYSKYTKKWQEKNTKSKKSTGGNPYYTQKAYLGDKYIELSYKKYYQNKIDKIKLSEYLNIKPKNISNFEHFVFN